MSPAGIVDASAPRESWLLVSGVCILLVAAACSGGDVASPPAPTVPSPSPPIAANPAPPELQGLWITVLKDGSGQQVTLRLSETVYEVTRGADHAVGAIAVHGDQIEFSESSACVGTGTYRWSLKGDSLAFTAVRSDLCSGRREVLDGLTYTKA